MSWRDRIAGALIGGRLPGQMTAAEVAAVQAADAARTQQFNVMAKARAAMEQAQGDRAAAAQGVQGALDWYGARTPTSDRNAQFIGARMREHDDALKLLQGDAPITYGNGMPWTYGAGLAAPVALGAGFGAPGGAEAAPQASFADRWNAMDGAQP